MPLDWKTKPVADSDRWLFEPIPKRIRLGINFDVCLQKRSTLLAIRVNALSLGPSLPRSGP